MSAIITSSRADPLDNPDVSIRLRRLNSATSSTASLETTATLPPYSDSSTGLHPDPDRKDPFLSLDDASSTHSHEASSRPFHAEKLFQIQCVGKPHLSLPTPSKELEIGIDELGPVGEEVERYRSIRPERRRGNCTLFLNNVHGEQVPVAQTTYRWGPGKPPVVKLFSLTGDPKAEDGEPEVLEEIVLESPGTLSRTVVFTSSRFGKLQWRYGGKKEKKEFKHSSSEYKLPPNRLLTLEKIVRESGGKREVVEVARIIRSDELRAKGSTSRFEGNGGRLEIDFGALLEGTVGGLEALSGEKEERVREMEGLVLSTALALLKKEVDRLRAIQMMFIVGVVANPI